MFGVPQTGSSDLFKPSGMFTSAVSKPDGDDGEESDGAVAPDENEAPVYAEAEKVKFAEGVEVQKSPYTKVLDVSPLP